MTTSQWSASIQPTDRSESASRRAAWVESVALFLLGFAFFSALYAATVRGSGREIGLPENDSFYHVAMASMIPRHGLLATFPWLQDVYWRSEGDAFVSHHVGFHIVLLPFVVASKWLTGDEMAGGRWAMCCMLGLNLVLFNLLLRAVNAPLRWLWIALFFLLPDQFFVRHAYVRAISISAVFMQLLLLSLFARRAVWTAVILAAYVHVYLGAAMYGSLIVAIHAAALAFGGPDARRFLPRAVVAAALGWTVGVLTHPYRAGMFEFLWLQVFGTGLTPDIEVGREWLPYRPLTYLVQISWPIMAAWIASAAMRICGPRLDPRELTLLALNLAFLALTLKARRFIEYWPLMALLSAAYLATPPMRSWIERRRSRAEAEREPGAQPAFGVFVRARGWLLALLVPVAVLLLGAASFRSIVKQIGCRYDLPVVREMMAFIRADSRPGDVIFTDDWDVFPVYFYHNRQNYYLVGLDPKFTHWQRPDLWDRYVKITRGQTPAMIDVAGAAGQKRTVSVTLADIRDVFGARYVICDRDHRRLADQLAADAALAEFVYPRGVYADAAKAEYRVFRIRR
ncbi:MAG: hypothetical protein U1D55_19635 [Phycisphaerae bacterium]